MASSSIFPFVAFLSDAKAKDEELFGPSERRGRFAIVLLLGVVVVVFDITQQGGSFLHKKKPTMMMKYSHTKDKKVETF